MQIAVESTSIWNLFVRFYILFLYIYGVLLLVKIIYSARSRPPVRGAPSHIRPVRRVAPPSTPGGDLCVKCGEETIYKNQQCGYCYFGLEEEECEH